MGDKTYSKDPIQIRRPGKVYLVVTAGVLLFIGGQVLLRFLPLRSASGPKEAFVEDSNRTVFKEEDIAKGLKNFANEAKESYLSKLRMTSRVRSDSSASKPERLGPVLIVRREELKAAVPLAPLPEQKSLGLPLGTKIPAVLKDKIFSFNVENRIEAEAVKDVYYLGKLKVPKGTKFFGDVSLVHSEDRVNIHFHRLLFPWGEERAVTAVAHSADGSGGIKGKVNRRWFNKVFSIAGKTTLGALTLLTVPNRQDAFSLDNQLRLNASSNLSQEAVRELDSLKVDKAITVEGHIPIQIVLLESL